MWQRLRGVGAEKRLPPPRRSPSHSRDAPPSTCTHSSHDGWKRIDVTGYEGGSMRLPRGCDSDSISHHQAARKLRAIKKTRRPAGARSFL
ncbi:hypothetical protein MRX96_016517 [Rhipicephalus microplus]